MARAIPKPLFADESGVTIEKTMSMWELPDIFIFKKRRMVPLRTRIHVLHVKAGLAEVTTDLQGFNLFA